MRTELKRLHERLGATFIYVTHDQAEAMTMADRIVVMSRGHIEQVGTPLEIYDRPATQFVASFFGMPTMNFLEGSLDADGAATRFRGDGIEQAIEASLPPGAGSRRVVLGVRAEHVIIDEAGPTAGTARLLEPLGDATLVHFEAQSGASLVAKVAPSSTLAPGAPLGFRLSARHCHLFDAESRQRLN